jgi:hypothetical protein
MNLPTKPGLTLAGIGLLMALLAACAQSGGDEAADDAAADDDNDHDPSVDDDNDDDNDNDASPPDDIWANLTPQGLPVSEIMGMATQMYDGPDDNPDRDFEIAKLLEAGLFRLRASIDWPDVEPQQDAFTFDHSDPFVQLVTDAGLQFDGRLCYGVDWAAPDDNDNAILPADFADYAGHVAEHYCGVIDSHEIWNEENLERFWQPAPDPEHYGALLKATYTAVHAACPGAKVVWGGLSCFDETVPAHGLYYFIEQVYQAHPDIADYFDVLAIHPYTFLQTTSPEWRWTDGGDVEFWPGMPGQIRVARERLAAIGAAGKPIWLTEWGWPSLIIGDQRQADWLARGALLSIAAGVEALDWYTFYDREGGSFPPTEDYFGLFTWPGAPEGPQEKPAFRAARGLSIALGDMRFAGDLSAALGLPIGVYGLAFMDEESGRIALAAWDGRYQQTQTLNLPPPASADRYETLDEAGVLTAEGNVGPPLSLELTNQVVYVLFTPWRADGGKIANVTTKPRSAK